MNAAFRWPADALGLGVRTDSAHTSKTMMLPELRALLDVVAPSGTLSDYRSAAVDHDAMGKRTATTRVKTFAYLRKLYVLDASVALFAALRALWDLDANAQPLIAICAATARDPALQATASTILGLQIGDQTGPKELAAAVEEALPQRFNPNVRHHIGQNAGASWVQAGLLRGVIKKYRVHPQATYPAVTYALCLGHLQGVTGPALFSTMWARLMDADETTLHSLAEMAARTGWLEMRSAGGMLDITFRHLDSLTSNGAKA